MNNNIICPFCKTENKENNKRCISCGGLLEGRTTILTKQDRKLIRNYAKIVEEMIISSDSTIDMELGIILFGSVVIQAFVIYVTYARFDNIIWSILISLFVFVILIFGSALLLRGVERKACKLKFQNHVKYTIKNYLHEMNFNKKDFQNIIKKEFDKESYLYKFIDEL